MSDTTTQAKPDVQQLIIDHDWIVGWYLKNYRLPQHVNEDEAKAEILYWIFYTASQFDPSRGILFSTYARRSVRLGMLSWLRSKSSAKQLVKYALGNSPLTPHQLVSRPDDKNESGGVRDEWVADDSPNHVDLLCNREQVEKLLRCLPAWPRKVIEYRFGVGSRRGRGELRLHEVGKLLGIGRERTRQIQVMALEIIRRHIKGKP